MGWFTDLIDKHTERAVRRVAHRHGRRSALARLGVGLVGGALLPMLPFDRSGGTGVAHAAGGSAAKPGGPTDDATRCEYWRYCAVDGFLCSCCGGSLTTCPRAPRRRRCRGSAPASTRRTGAST